MSLLIGLSLPTGARAEVTDLSDVPLANSPSDAVLPNLMYILDDSGSMLWDYMPDNAQQTTTGYTANNCKSCTTSSCTINARQCALGNPGSTDGNTADWGEPPYFSTQFNQIYYNPNITYNPALTSTGVSLGNNVATSAHTDRFLNNLTYTNLITASPAVAPNKYYCNTATPTASNLTTASKCVKVTDLTLVYPEIYYCNTSTPTAAQLTDTTVCRRNGVNNVSGGYFLYFSNDPNSGGYPIQTGTASTSFNNQVISKTGHPYYFTITPNEYCSDINLTLCQLANSDGTAPSGFSVPAPVRYCKTTADSSSTAAVSGNSGANPRCQQKFDQSNYPYPRYGRFTRTDIVSTTATYPKGAQSVRTDCASTTSCTYAEELQNFANWWGYYRTRMQTMKTATGRAFLPIDDRYRVGFLTINPNNPVTASKYLSINTFNATQKNSWYTLLYQQTSNGSTPLRQSLSRAGRHYAGITTGINSGMINASNPDPVQYSCQQNFSLLTTDGYYNDAATDTQDVNGNNIGNVDAIEDTTQPIFVSRSSGTLDGNGAKSTVATPTTNSQQVICIGNAAWSSPYNVVTGGTQPAGTCGCTGNQTRLYQRDLVATTTISLTEGSQTGSNTTYTNTFTAVTGCTTPLVVTTVTPMQQFEDKACTAGASVTFTGTFTASTRTCGCPANQHQILTATANFNQTTQTTDGVATGGTVNSAPTVSYSGTACTAAAITVNQRVDTKTEDASCSAGATATFPSGFSTACTTANFASATAGTRAVLRNTISQTYQQQVVDGVAGSFVLQTTTNNAVIAPGSAFVAPLTRTDTLTYRQTEAKLCNNGAPTTLSFTDGSTYTCPTAASCNKKTLITHTQQATQTKTYLDNVLQTTTPASLAQGNFSSLSNSASSCANNPGSAAGVSPALPGTLISTVTTTGPNGQLLQALQSPNPSTLVTGSVTVVSSSGSGLTITRSPNPSVAAASGVAPTVTNNSGTTLVSTLSPNPTTTGGTSTTTQFAGGTANTLADVAMYYYKTDLRPCPGGTPASGTCITDPKATDNVPNTSKDFINTQHMTTFTLGLGLQGLMNYTADYETNPTSDFAKIKTASTNCTFSTGICDWPAPVAASPTALDDLWHAAVNGRGVYYSASDPNSLADGLSGALAALKIQTAAASASATSSPNITQTNNFIYSSTFRTVKWDGEVVAQTIDTSTGNVLPTILWSAQSQLDALVSSNSDTRTIYAFKTGATNNLVPFTYANLLSSAVGGIAAEQPYFTNKCTALSQCPLLASGDQTTANDGASLVNYLRGQTQFQGAAFRARDHVLGDPVNATPAYIQAPTFSFVDSVSPTYASFQTANANRTGVLYIAANDGMLHAFNGATGAEMWAFVPRIVMPNMHHLATDNWDVNHTFLVDGSPQIMDAYDNRTDPAHPAWKTLLVAGLNKGGKGYYALDITNPASPKGLWQTCSDSTLCEHSDADIGYSFGNPVITKRAFDGRWVVIVTSGYDNVTGSATGRGFLYVLDAFSGAILSKVDTTVGSLATPSGLAKISAFATSFNTDNTSTWVYGGDLLGNVWRFDMSQSTPVAFKMASLVDSGGKPQSITSRPELGIVSSNRVVFVGTGRYLGNSDLFDPSTLTPVEQWAYKQSIYALKDKFAAGASAGYGDPRSNLVAQTLTDNGGTVRTASSNLVNWVTKDGWYVDLSPGGASPGERVNLDPQLIQGTLVAVTNVPNNSACSVGGDSFTYQFDYSSGKAVQSSTGGAVAQKTIGQITVGVVVFRRPSGVFTGVGTGATGIKTPFGINIGGSGGSGRRVSWRELIR